MPGKTIRILNFDGSVIRQKALLSRYKAEVVGLEDIGPRARFWLDKKTRRELEARILPSPAGCVSLLGSGDFHHISSLLISQYTGPLSVIVFDAHPDWDRLSPFLTCGSWMHDILKMENVAKFLLLGMTGGDISSLWVQTGDMGSLSGGRLEIYPYSHAPSLVLFAAVPENPSIRVERKAFSSRILWDGLEGKDMPQFIYSLMKRLPARRVYISIDKDCLKGKYAYTNWEEGGLSLDELLSMLKVIKENSEIVGADISGDYSRIRLSGFLKNIVSSLDHPREVKASAVPEEFTAVLNAETNLAIMDTLSS